MHDRGERRKISIWCQKECVESKLDGQTNSHSDYSAHLWVVQIFDTKSLGHTWKKFYIDGVGILDLLHKVNVIRHKMQ